MALSFLVDENVPGRFLRAVQRHNARGLWPLTCVRVSEPEELPLGSNDPTIMLWTEQNGHILLTLDERSMRGHLTQHLNDGHHLPGIFSIHPSARMADVLDFLVLAAYASDAAEWRDHIRYIP